MTDSDFDDEVSIGLAGVVELEAIDEEAADEDCL